MCIYLKQDGNDLPYMLFLQWHITAKCDQKCKHCYMFDSKYYEGERNNELPLEKCFSIVDDFANTVNMLGIKGSIVFGGGDPLLREDIFEIISYASKKGVDFIGIMGNSYHINKEKAKKLKESGVSMYQISLDGLKNTHDYLRKPGSFDDAIRGFEVLKEAGLQTACMFTVSKINSDELLDVIRLAHRLEITAFDFDRMVPVGAGADLYDDILTSYEYKELLEKVNHEYDVLKAVGTKTRFGCKDSLWCLLKAKHHDDTQGILPGNYRIERGCIIGKSGLAVLADGKVMACRRLPLVIGKLPEEKIIGIFNHSNELIGMKECEEIKKCGTCEKINECRGCRAVAYSFSGGDIHAKDPQCWFE